jgi:hypothetical protein
LRSTTASSFGPIYNASNTNKLLLPDQKSIEFGGGRLYRKIADSSRQATLNISAIKYDLETNNLIKLDYGEIKGNVIEDFALEGEGEEVDCRSQSSTWTYGL